MGARAVLSRVERREDTRVLWDTSRVDGRADSSPDVIGLRVLAFATFPFFPLFFVGTDASFFVGEG